jgi:methylamine dehydrogenase accessory protein MauD
MTGAGLSDVSYAALWILVAVNTIVLVAMVRQVGVVLLRVGQIQAPRSGDGPRVGEVLRIRELSAPSEVAVPADNTPLRRLLVFLSPDCGLCRELVPAANAVARGYGDRFDVFMIVDGDEARVQGWSSEARSRVPMIAARDALDRYGIPGAPFACIINHADAVLASAWVNHMEHLEALIRSCPRDLPHDVHSNGDRPAVGSSPTVVPLTEGAADGEHTHTV